MAEGWIKLYRKIEENPIVMKDGDHLSVWVFLLIKATHQKQDMLFNKERITLDPGQLITSRFSISRNLSVSESKVERILKALKSAHQIEQRSCSTSRLITILNWDAYQMSEQQNGQGVDSERTASEQRVDTNKNVRKKECKKESSEAAPPRKTFKQFSEKEFYDLIATFKDHHPKELLREFFDYWKEPDPTGKMRFQLQRTWDTNLRLKKWSKNDFSKKPAPTIELNPLAHLKIIGQ